MWAAVAVTGAGGVLAAVAASLRSLRQPVVHQLRRTSGMGARGVLALEVSAVVLAAVVVWQAWGGRSHAVGGAGSPDPLALLAPGLFAFAAALVTARAVPRWPGCWVERPAAAGTWGCSSAPGSCPAGPGAPACSSS